MFQRELEELLRKKGIGPQGSKSLATEDLERLSVLMFHTETSLTTRCTILLALLLLEKTEEENVWISSLRARSSSLEMPLQKLLNNNTDTFEDAVLTSLLNKKDLGREDCLNAMNRLFTPEVPDHWKGCFLEGERLKRENAVENAAFFESLWDRCDRVQTDLPILIDIADNYDGFNRYYNYALFLAPALAAAGYPCYLHGIEQVAPKFGYTTHQLLKLAEKKTNTSLPDAVTDLKEKGWTYVDQSVFFPALSELRTMRKEMVKRPFLATFEKLLQPIRAVHGNHILCGYTHAHYKDEVIQQLKDLKQCKEAIVAKGLEGNSQLPLARATTVMHFDGQKITEHSVSPEQAGITISADVIEKQVSAEKVLAQGLAALKGEHNEARNRLLYMAWVIAEKFRLEDPVVFQNKIIEMLDSGKALEKWSVVSGQ